MTPTPAIKNPHGYKIRSWVGQKEGRRQAARAFYSAISPPDDFFKSMGRPGVSFSEGQRKLIESMTKEKL
jgi:hypothetical protein